MEGLYIHRFLNNLIRLFNGPHICVFQSFLCDFKVQLKIRTTFITKQNITHAISTDTEKPFGKIQCLS